VFNTFLFKTFYTYSYVHLVQIKILIKLFTRKVFKFVFSAGNGVGYVFLKMKPMTKIASQRLPPPVRVRPNNNNQQQQYGSNTAISNNSTINNTT